MSEARSDQSHVSSILLLAITFIVAVAVSNIVFRGWRIDLTDDNLYTLSDGTRSMLEKIDEPINLYFFFSDQASESVPSLRRYAERVNETLEEFVSAANGKINLTTIDPLPFSEEEDRAASFGLQGISVGLNTDPIYLGLAGTDSLDNEETITFFQPDKEAFLEYDIAKLVSTLANPDRTVIGLVSGVDMAGGFNPQTQQMSPPWVVYEQANQLFDIRNLGTTFGEIADDIGLLWIVQPKGLSDHTLYAIDQFVLRGGRAMVFVDPLAEIDPSDGQGMPQGMPPIGQSSNLEPLFAAWGIQFDISQVAADAQLALQISGADRRPVRHFGFLGVTGDQMSPDDIITSDLDVINFATAGSISHSDEATSAFEPLISTSANSQNIPATRFSFLPDPSSLQNGFSPGGEPLTLAARVSGSLNSAFPDGRPVDTVSTEATEDTGPVNEAVHLANSEQPANIIVVADVDLLSNQMWVQVQSFFGQQIANAFASNGTFVVNALENLSGSSDLIGVRSRTSYSRPFTRVDALRVEAEAQYRETEQRLQSELTETENRLRELQSSREDSGNILPSDEQQDEIDRFIEQRAAIRRDLRAVQRGLDQNIERLGTVLKAINIGLVPLILTMLVLVHVRRRSRRVSAQ